MAIEDKRGCGFRKVGGIYLVGNIFPPKECPIMPIELPICPVCSGGIKFSRGYTQLNPKELLDTQGCTKCKDCPFTGEEAGLMWVGEKFYTTTSFISEAIAVDVSKRVSTIPRSVDLGTTWILLAHKKGKVIKKGNDCKDCEKFDTKKCPTKENDEDETTQLRFADDKQKLDCFQRHESAIFYAFIPTKVEKLVWKSDWEAMSDENKEALKKRGIEVVVVPDGDPDHRR